MRRLFKFYPKQHNHLVKFLSQTSQRPLTFPKYNEACMVFKDPSVYGLLDGIWTTCEKDLKTHETCVSTDPSTGQVLFTCKSNTTKDYNKVMKKLKPFEKVWRNVPAPKRGEILKEIGDALKDHVEPLGKIISAEVGKSLAEGIGEVQESIDICNYAVGLSRMYDGKVLQSERPNHTLIERWNPLGTVGVISAFNFPQAVFMWNFAIAIITGNLTIWKPSPSTPSTSVATANIINKVLDKHIDGKGVFNLILGHSDIGKAMSKDPRINLLSFTGSTNVGREVGIVVQERMGKHILELGGNNAAIIHNDADLDIALKSVFFGAIGTSGQRCTTTRRLFIHNDIYEQVVEKLRYMYQKIEVGCVFDKRTVIGPLHTGQQVTSFINAVSAAKKEKGKVLFGGNTYPNPTVYSLDGCHGNFVEPTLIEMESHSKCMNHETFVPILYVLKYADLDEAISMNNSVSQGLSSTLFTNDHRNIFKWISENGSDCGLVNVNTSTSGAEIGGAFGGEKESGGGRESGSDAWKQYCCRVTSTINYGFDLPLAQGIKFQKD